MGKASKATKKFASSGQLKKTIDARKKHQQVRKRIQGRKTAKPQQKQDDAPEEDEEEVEQPSKKKGYVYRHLTSIST